MQSDAPKTLAYRGPQSPQRIPNFGAFTIGEFLEAVEKSSYADRYQTLSNVAWQDNIEPHECHHCKDLTLRVVEKCTDTVYRIAAYQSGEPLHCWVAELPGCPMLQRLVTHDRKLSEWEYLRGLGPLQGKTASATLWKTSGYLVPDRFGANMHLSAQKETLASTLIKRMPRNRTVLPDKTLCDIRKWLKECHSKHGCVQLDESGRSNPTRLIQIRSKNTNTKLKLIQTSPAVSYSWCALSYCWGSDSNEKNGARAIKAIQTTREKLSEYLEDIPIARLPQTLKDAIFVTSQLGIEYIWIDCLCIVQNDNDHDKQHELTKMPGVYQQSYVTLSASSAAQSTDGFLCDRDFGYTDEDMIPCSISLYCDSTHQGQVLAHDESASYSKFQGKDPILDRAWTLQEALLSPRLLEFSAGQVRWRCTKSRASDSYKSALDNRFIVSEYISQTSYNLQCSKTRELEWEKILGQYWPREAQYERDRLIAISALARVFGSCAKEPGQRYLAGMWEAALPFNLLWHVTEFNGTLKDGYRAPTWSWASIKGDKGQFSQECCRLSEGRLSLVTVVDCAVVTEPINNRYAAAKSGYIILKGQVNFMKELQGLGRVSPSAFTATYVGGLKESNPYVWHVHIDRKRIQDPDEDTQLKFQTRKAPPSRNICVMLVAETPRIARSPGFIQGLLLRYEPSSDTFERIGIFHHELADWEVKHQKGSCTYGVPGWEDREVKIL